MVPFSKSEQSDFFFGDLCVFGRGKTNALGSNARGPSKDKQAVFHLEVAHLVALIFGTTVKRLSPSTQVSFHRPTHTNHAATPVQPPTHSISTALTQLRVTSWPTAYACEQYRARTSLRGAISTRLRWLCLPRRPWHTVCEWKTC